MEAIKARQREVEALLEGVQDQLYTLENKYLDETGPTGNVVKGWEGYIDSKPRTSTAQPTKKDRKFKMSNLIFSYSSVTSPLANDEKDGGSISPSLKRLKSNGSDASNPKPLRKKKRKRKDDPDFEVVQNV
mmetsp:Transcript_5264/g.9483  ORF Transcript_5264/g.9483 Transcript_5264/m.9483 type:complete len:131 (-) Transcript_5264:122-514(-)|eukprot:CAMPEP_0184520234 /NCGR_PEP_ID=MMETSP0198_2-20121128/7055_1 /TAXON_ID=1112570 /ORGANISM="Thraustochytrium sp., Strain LLF1b" /LENGTH=130 /DNA_ID=CAMNT_0026910811 /DNA_START=347 /DNA_END=739 /DNA_ORIENTATION=+